MLHTPFTSDDTRPRLIGAALIIAMIATVFVTFAGTAEAASLEGKYNFQPAGARVPADFTADTGQAFSSNRGFGWTKYNGDETPVDMSSTAFNRNVANDERLDTSIGMTERRNQWGRWEMDVAKDNYRLWITLGDTANPGERHYLAIEDDYTIDWTSSANERTKSFKVELPVTDGRLTYSTIKDARTALVATTVIRLGGDVAAAPSDNTPTEPKTTTTTAPTKSSEPAPTTTVPRTQTTSPAPEPVDGSTNGAIAGFAPGGHFPGMSMDKINVQLDYMAASGAQWLRMPFLWTSIENRQGQFNFKKLDQIVDAANKRNIKIIANLSYTPAWARIAGCSTMFCAPAKNSDFANYVEKTVAHFLPMGVGHFELWNEPNMAIFFQPQPDIDKYTGMVKASYQAVKPKYPKATILMGSFAPARDLKNGNQVKATTFLEGMYRNGVKGNFDAVSYHPYNYPAAPEVVADWHSFSGVVPELQGILRSNGDSNKTDIWGTEYGYHTGTNGGGISEATQADYVGRSYAAWKKISNAPLIWFSLTNRGTDRHDREDMFGILEQDYTPKPAWGAFKTAMRQKR